MEGELVRTLDPRLHAFWRFNRSVKVERPYLRETLAWARIDRDGAAGEALIEEIQSGWVSRAGSIWMFERNPPSRVERNPREALPAHQSLSDSVTA